jgi:hypothetical protein
MTLARLIRHNLGCVEFQKVHYLSVLYLLHAVNASKFNREFKTLVPGVSAKDFRLKLANSGHCSITLKLMVLEMVANRRNKKYVQPCNEDAVLISDYVGRKELTAVVKQIIDLYGGRDNLPTKETLDVKLAQVLKAVEGNMRNTVYRRLRFVCKAHSSELSDMVSDIRAKVIQAYYWQSPNNWSLEHHVRSAHTVIKNTAIFLIEHHTFKKRARMIRDEEGNFKLMEAVADDPQELVSQVDTQFYEGIDTSIAAKQLISKFATSNRKALALKFMMGIPDAKFTHWLRKKNRVSKHGDNTTYQDAVASSEFLVTVSEYLKVSPEKFMKFVLNLRKAAGGDGVYAKAAAAA